MIDSHAFSKPSAETRNYTISMHKQGSLKNGAGVKLLHYTQKKAQKDHPKRMQKQETI